MQFNDNPGSIEATGATLNLSEGESMALVGGEISLNDIEINAPAGRIDLVGVREAGHVSFEVGDINSGFPSFGVPAELSRASVSLDEANLNVVGVVGGEIGIQALDVEMRDSVLRGGIAEGLGIEGGQSGNIELDAMGNITISDSQLSNSVREDSVGNAGNINVIAGEIEGKQGAELNTGTSGQGNAGSVTVQASGSVVFTGANAEGVPSGAFSSIRETGQGNAGTVRIVGNRVEVRDGALLSSSSFGQGNAGSVIVEAQDIALFSATNEKREDFATGAGSILGETGRGNAGNVIVMANTIEVRDGAQLNSTTFGEGNAGTISIEARDTVIFFDGDAFSGVGEMGIGNGGNIRVIGNRVEVRDGAQLISNTLGQGDAGRIDIHGAEAIVFSGENSEGSLSGAFSSVLESGQGNAGEINLSGNHIEVSDQAELSSSTFSEGDAGNVIIEAQNTVFLSNGNVFSEVTENGLGHGGNIRIVGNRVEIQDGAQLISNTLGQGNAGRIDIHGTEAIIFSGENSDGFPSGAFSTVLETGQGNAGEINLSGNYIEVSDQAKLSSSTFGEGDAGNVIIEARNTVFLSNGNVFSEVTETGMGNGGNIRVIGNRVEVRNGAQLISNTLGQGDAGRIDIHGADAIIFSGENSDGFPSGAFSTVLETGQGNAGEINLSGNYIEVSDQAKLSSSTFGEGDAGNVIVEARNTVFLSNGNVFSEVTETGRGNGGNIRIIGNRVEVQDGAQLVSSTLGQGDAGRINIQGAEAIVISGENSDGFSSGAFSTVRESANGHGGDVYVAGNVVEVRDGAFLSSSTAGIGNAGNITIEGEERVVIFDGSAFSSVLPGGRGNAGNLRILGDRIEVSNSASLSSNTAGEGDGGILSLEAANQITLSDVFITTSVGETAQGNAGSIQVSSHQIEVNEGANLVSSAFGDGNSGTVTIEVGDRVVFSGAGVSSSAGRNYPGNAGSVKIFGNIIEFINRTNLSSDTFGVGEGGNILIQASDRVTFSDSWASSGTFANSGGNAGEIRVLGNIVEVRDGASLSSSTIGTGNAGSVSIEANDHVLFSNGWAASNALTNSGGNAGEVRVTGDTVEVRDRAFLSSGTAGTGNAGRVTVEANDRVVFSNSLASTSVAQQGRGNAGNVSVLANTVELRDGARLSSSNNTTSNANDFAAGDVLVQADRLHLSDRADISANTGGRGGNVRLDTGTTILRRGSTIQTNAEGDFPGGNIIIDTDALVALENSDITANAINAAGGRVIINTQGIFGTEFRDELTPESDITASSDLGAEFSGSV
ncbi:S-layer family protein, partial [Geitlerinema sp. P-1104]|nr:S-layer family protein [Geitlerinema sp. P-1104]